VRVRPGASIAAAVVITLTLSACSVFTRPHTQEPYDPGDGVSVTVGDIRVLNAIVFTDDGEDGNFFAAVVNSGDDDVDLTLQYRSGGEKIDIAVEVPAGETVRFGTDGAQVLLPGIETPAGSLLPVYFQYGDTPGKQIDVPVLDTELDHYAGLEPTPTPTVTATPTPAPAPTP